MQLDTYLADTGTTITAFAREVGVSRFTTHRWLSGECIPAGRHMRRIAEATGGKVGPADFYPDLATPQPAAAE